MGMGTTKGVKLRAMREAGLWPCGHPRTAENTRSVGVAGVRCATCRREISRRSFHHRKALLTEA